MEHSAWNIEGTYPPGAPAEMSESARLFGFWRRPELAMRDIVARPSFFAPLALVCVAAIVYTLVVMPSAFRQSSGLPMAMAGTVVGALVRLLILTGLLAAIVTAVAHASVDFRQLFAIACYSRIPGVLFTALAVLLILLHRASGLDDGRAYNPMITSVAWFLNPYAYSRFLYSLASSVDIVIFWQLSLVSVGLKATSRVSASAAATSVVLLWALYALLQAAWLQWRV